MKDTRRKVCVVLPSHWSGLHGGAELQARYLLDALIATERYDVTYVARWVAPGFSAPGYRVVQVGRQHNRSLLSDAPSLYRSLVSIRPDVIYQRVGGVYTGVSAAYAINHRCRMVWHVARDDDVSPGPYISSLVRPRAYLDRKLLKFGIRHASSIITQTHEQAKMLKQNHGRSAVGVIPNFQPPPCPYDGTKPERVTAAWIANLKPAKRPEIFLRLAQRLRESGVRFVMAGRPDVFCGSSDLLRKIAACTNIEYIGELSQDGVHKLLETSHVFVNTSALEGFPNTFIQAWMRRAAVVSLSVDPDGVLTKKGVGIWAGSEERLVEWVARLIRDPDLREQLVDKAQRHAFEVHSLGNTRRVLEVIDGLGEGAERPSSPHFLPSHRVFKSVPKEDRET